MFSPLPDKPDHDALERAILEVWEREGTFARLREQNAGGPRFSFVDGPVTANRMVLGVHTAWGRTLKDVFQRYKALRGDPVENGGDGMAGATPLSPEVHDDGLLGSDDLLLEGRGRYVECHLSFRFVIDVSYRCKRRSAETPSRHRS